MTQKHSPEPWCTDQMSHEEPLMDITIIAANDDRVAKVWIDDAPVEDFNARQRLNARRIVACVNACRGLPTDELERKGLVAAVGAQLLAADDRAEGQEREIRKLARTTADAENKLADALNQRDELLAAIEDFIKYADDCRDDSPELDRARAAIKKITGETK